MSELSNKNYDPCCCYSPKIINGWHVSLLGCLYKNEVSTTLCCPWLCKYAKAEYVPSQSITPIPANCDTPMYKSYTPCLCNTNNWSCCIPCCCYGKGSENNNMLAGDIRGEMNDMELKVQCNTCCMSCCRCITPTFYNTLTSPFICFWTNKKGVTYEISWCTALWGKSTNNSNMCVGYICCVKNRPNNKCYNFFICHAGEKLESNNKIKTYCGMLPVCEFCYIEDKYKHICHPPKIYTPCCCVDLDEKNFLCVPCGCYYKKNPITQNECVGCIVPIYYGNTRAIDMANKPGPEVQKMY